MVWVVCRGCESGGGVGVAGWRWRGGEVVERGWARSRKDSRTVGKNGTIYGRTRVKSR